jgi:hypothetical protein
VGRALALTRAEIHHASMAQRPQRWGDLRRALAGGTISNCPRCPPSLPGMTCAYLQF